MKKNNNNKDVIRHNKNKNKYHNKKKIAKSKNKTITKKEKEAYMRKNRNTSIYMLEELKNNKFLYKIKDWIIDWWMDNHINDNKTFYNDDFWCKMSSNKNAEFLFNNTKSLKCLVDCEFDTDYMFPEIGLLFHKFNIKQTTYDIDSDDMDFDDITGEPLVDEFYNLMWDLISRDTSSQAMDLLEQHMQHDNWTEYINLGSLCGNTNPRAIHIIEQNLDKITSSYCWHNIFGNPNAINIIENNLDQLGLSIEEDGTLMYYALGYSPNRNYVELLENPKALHIIDNMLGENPALRDSPYLSDLLNRNPNPNIISIIKKYTPGGHAADIAHYPDAINIIEEEIEDEEDLLDCWEALCQNPNAIHIIEQNIEKIINIYERENDPMNKWWSSLCQNPNAIHIIEKYIEKIINIYECKKTNMFWWRSLCQNPNATHIIEKYIEKFKPHCFIKPDNFNHTTSLNYGITASTECWHALCLNPNAIYIIEQNLHHIDTEIFPNIFPMIFSNPSIFEINYEYLQNQFDYINRKTDIDEIIRLYERKNKYLSYNNLVFNLLEHDLIRAVFHPTRVGKHLEKYNYYICLDEYADDD